MKKYHFLTVGMLTVLALMSSGTALAQRPGAQPTPTPQRPATQPAPTPSSSVPANLPVAKMAVIYTEAFLDDKQGIRKFNAMLTKLNGEFQKQKDELTQMSQRAQTLQEELTKLQNAPAGTPIDSKSVQTKSDQLDQLKRDIQRKGEDAQAAYNKRRSELFAPLQDEIGKALEIFAKAHNINVIIDGTQVPLIYAADSIDITQAFINEFNSKNPVTAATTPPQ